jgi:hypothetical protein
MDTKIRKYRGCYIMPAGPNASGIRWTTLTPHGTLRAQTLAGMRALITERLRPRRFRPHA